MDDRIAEIREALTTWDAERDLVGSVIDITPIVDAARAYVDLLDSVEEDRRVHPYWAEGYKSGEDDGAASGYDQGFRAGLMAGMASLDSDALIIRRDDIDYPAAAKWLQQRWESEAVQDGFPATPWDDLEPEDRDWWLTHAQSAVDAALASSQGVEP